MHNNGKPHPPGQALDVVVIGEALTDVVTTPEGTNEHPGGSPANVAYGLARLRVSTGLITSIGADRRGDVLQEHLTGAGVTLLPGSHTVERTSTATATITSDGSASYAFDITWDMEPPDPAPTAPKVLHTGSIASFLSPGAAKIKAILQQLRNKCTITYDPNIRPALLGTHAEARRTFEDLVHLTNVVKLSDEDAEWLYPKKALAETATHILGLGADLAVITKGPSGSLLATPATSLTIPAVKTSVVDTIGAGDSYMSALILGLLTRGTGGRPSRPRTARTHSSRCGRDHRGPGRRPAPNRRRTPRQASAPAPAAIAPITRPSHAPPLDVGNMLTWTRQVTLDTDVVTRVTSIT